MNKERLIGTVFSIILLLLVLFVFLTPQVDYQQEFKSKESIIEIKDPETRVEPIIQEEQIIIKTPLDKMGASSIEESDFDLFVIRVHVLSSNENAVKMVGKINNGGFPAFTEVFGTKKDLHAVYVGPFLSEEDIVSNITLIEKVSESTKGEISRWKL